jgi:hypothetical protein
MTQADDDEERGFARDQAIGSVTPEEMTELLGGQIQDRLNAHLGGMFNTLEGRQRVAAAAADLIRNELRRPSALRDLIPPQQIPPATSEPGYVVSRPVPYMPRPRTRPACGGLCLHLGRMAGPHKSSLPSLELDMIINLRGLRDENYDFAHRADPVTEGISPVSVLPEIAALRAYRQEHTVHGSMSEAPPTHLYTAAYSKANALHIREDDHWYKGKLDDHDD